MVKIALAQINPTLGSLRENSKKIIKYIEIAKEKGANFVVFPELALTGYPPEDLLFKNSFISQTGYFLKKITAKTAGLTLILGFVEKKENRTYNSCAIIQNKKLIDTYQKMSLPNFGVFDEKRYFWAGETLPVYQAGKINFSVTICRDLWEKENIRALKNKNLNFILNIAASPFSLNKEAQRKKILSFAAKTTGSFVFYCNLVGGQDEIIFDGKSSIYSPSGKLLNQAKGFSEDILWGNLKETPKTLPAPASRINNIYCALSLGITDYMKKNNFNKAVIGLSGGIDSALTLAITAKSIGPAKTTALIMPSCYSNPKSIFDAKKIAKKIGVNYQVIPIDTLINQFSRLLPKGKNNSLTEENVQARIRGTILMAFSNQFGHLVVNTGNKSEVSCGYCTLYGDLAGGFALLKDIYKTDVYALANFINKKNNSNLIPKSIINREPSAELRPGQKDSDTLPQYPLLDKILYLYLEKQQSFTEIARQGFDKKIIAKIINMIAKSEYKRKQAPPGIKISELAFGKDRRMPITNAFCQC